MSLALSTQSISHSISLFLHFTTPSFTLSKLQTIDHRLVFHRRPIAATLSCGDDFDRLRYLRQSFHGDGESYEFFIYGTEFQRSEHRKRRRQLLGVQRLQQRQIRRVSDGGFSEQASQTRLRRREPRRADPPARRRSGVVLDRGAEAGGDGAQAAGEEQAGESAQDREGRRGEASDRAPGLLRSPAPGVRRHGDPEPLALRREQGGHRLVRRDQAARARAAVGHGDGEGERGVRAAPAVADRGEQGRDRAVGRDPAPREPPRERRVQGKEGRVDGAVLALLGEGEQDQGGARGDHEAAGGADGRFGVENGRQGGVRDERRGVVFSAGGESSPCRRRGDSGIGGDGGGRLSAAEGDRGRGSAANLRGERRLPHDGGPRRRDSAASRALSIRHQSGQAKGGDTDRASTATKIRHRRCQGVTCQSEHYHIQYTIS